MNQLINKTDNKIEQIVHANMKLKKTVVFMGCLFLSATDNLTNIPLLMFMYHVYMIFHQYIDENPFNMSYFI